MKALGVVAIFLLMAAASLVVLRGGQPRAVVGGARVVALSPALSVCMRDLGYAGAIVGRHQWDLSLPASVPVCGDQSGIDYETLVSVSPTIVLTQWGERALPETFHSLVERKGWEHHDLSTLTLEEVEASVSRLDALMRGHMAPDAKTRVVGDDAGAWFRERVSRRVEGETGSVLLVGAIDPLFAFGPGSFHHDILLSVGGRAALTSGLAWVGLSAEDVRELDPWGIVFVLPGAGETEAATVLGRLAGSSVDAVVSGRVAVISDPEAHLPGTPMAEFADRLRGVLQEWIPEVGER